MGAGGGRARGPSVLVVATFLLGAFDPPASASSYPAMVSGFLSNAASAVVKRLWSLKSMTKTASGAKSMVKYEGGYTVEIQQSLKKNKSVVKPVMMVSSKTGAGIRNLRGVLGKLARFVKP